MTPALAYDAHSLDALTRQARDAAGRRDWEEALRCWEAARTSRPNDPAAEWGMANALKELGRTSEAEALLSASVTRFPNHAGIAIAWAHLANARRDWATARERWERVHLHFPDEIGSYTGSILAAKAAGANERAEALGAEALAALEAAKRRGLPGSSVHALELKIAEARADWAGVRRTAERIVADGVDGAVEIHLALAQACWRLKDREAADRAAERALEIEPRLAEALLVRAWAATERGDANAALAFYRELTRSNPGHVRWGLEFYQMLNLLGRGEEASEALRALYRLRPDHPVVLAMARNAPWWSNPTGAPPADEDDGAPYANAAPFRALFAASPDKSRRQRPVLIDDPGRDVQIVEAPEASDVVLVFTGSNDMLAMPLGLFDRFLAPLPATIVYLKDFERLRFLTGIRSLAGDYAGTLAALRRLVDGFGAKRLCVIGNCYGGFAAIRYGADLSADRILAFNAMTHGAQEVATRLERTRTFVNARLAEKVPAEMLDLAPFLAHRRREAQIDIFYDSDDEGDAGHALRLAGLPGVRLHPHSARGTKFLLRDIALASADFSADLAAWLRVEWR